MKHDFNDGAKSLSNALIPSVRDKDGTGYDIFSLLLKERIIVVAGQVETGMMATINAQLKFLEAQDSSAPITMLINSPGGSVIDGLAMVDIMREIKCPIHTVGNGMQASMGSILLAAGDERRMTKNSMLLIHQIMGGAAGGTQHSDFEISAAFMAKQHEKLKSVYVEFTGLNHKFWDVVGERDTWLSAEQAAKIGYIHSIVENEKPNGPYAAEAKRAVDPNSISALIDRKISTMNATEVIAALGNGQANEAEWGRHRPELVTRLAEFPEFWTAKRTSEFEAKNGVKAVAALANDNATELQPVAKKTREKAPKL